MSTTETVKAATVTESVQAKDVPSTEESPAPFAEVVRQFPTYGAAAQAACNFVNPRPNEQQLRFYISRLGPARGLKVGVGLPGTSSVLDLVRLDNDDTGKGIHFNARQRAGDNTNKLAAVITPTVALTAAQRQTQYNRWIADIQPIAAPVTLWNAWLSGTQPRENDLEGEYQAFEEGGAEGGAEAGVEGGVDGE